MRVGIVAKRGSERAVGLAEAMAEALAAADVTVILDEATRTALDRTAPQPSDADGQPGPGDVLSASASESGLADCDLAVSVGGDGTFLYTARNAGTTPLLGVNLGEVGFLTAVEPGDAVETTRAVVAEIRERGAPRTLSVPRLVADGPGWTLGPAVNEVVVQGPRRGHGGGLAASVVVDGATYADSHADGVLVATPFGSTAYNVSEGGPLVQPGVDGLVVTGMAAVSGMPPLVVRNDATLRLEISDAPTAVAVTDGLERRTFSPPAAVTVGLADEPLYIAEPSIDFFSALAKLE